jgi:hypothetical protein
VNAEPRRRRVLRPHGPDAANQQDAASFDARKVREIVRDELRRMFSRVFSDERTYSTRAGCAPEGYSRDAWRDLARRIGVKRGRYYVVSADELRAHERGEHPVKQEPANDAPAPAAWHPRDAARALGLRQVGGAR